MTPKYNVAYGVNYCITNATLMGNLIIIVTKL